MCRISSGFEIASLLLVPLLYERLTDAYVVVVVLCASVDRIPVGSDVEALADDVTDFSPVAETHVPACLKGHQRIVISDGRNLSRSLASRLIDPSTEHILIPRNREHNPLRNQR